MTDTALEPCGRFADLSNASLAAQCRMQAREALDPEYTQFMNAIADRLASLPAAPDGWRPIETAPHNQEVEVRAGQMTFRAMLVPDASMNSLEESCDQWQATRDGEHPPCWSGGACWESNEDEMMSLQPTAWRAAPKEQG